MLSAPSLPRLRSNGGSGFGEVASGEQGFGCAHLMTRGEPAPLGEGEVGGGFGKPELGEDAGGGGGEERGEEDGEDAAGLDEVVEDGIESGGLGGVLGEFEGLGLFDVEIGAIDQGPDGDQGALEIVGAEEAQGFVDGPVGIGGEFVGGGGDDAATVLVEHVEGAVEEVAEAIGELGIVTRTEAVVGPVAIGSDGEFADDVIAEGVETPFIDDGDGIDNVAGGFGEFVAVFLPPAVGEDLAWERGAQGVEHDGPVDGVELDDVLADDMEIGGPEVGAVGGGRTVMGAESGQGDGIAEGCGDGEVIGEGVEPHVGDPFRGEGKRDSPGKTAGGPGDAEVFETFGAEEAEDFVSADAGFDEGGIGFDMCDEPVLVTGHAEVPILFEQGNDLAPARIPGAIGIAVLLGQEGFFPDGIPTFVGLAIDVALVMEFGEHRGDDIAMSLLGGADEVVMGKPESHGQFPPLEGEGIAIGLGITAFGGGGLLDLLSVFVQTGEKEDGFAEAAMRAGDDIGDHLFVGVPEMRRPVGVIDGGGQIEPFAHGRASLPEVGGESNRCLEGGFRS